MNLKKVISKAANVVVRKTSPTTTASGVSASKESSAVSVLSGSQLNMAGVGVAKTTSAISTDKPAFSVSVAPKVQVLTPVNVQPAPGQGGGIVGGTSVSLEPESFGGSSSLADDSFVQDEELLEETQGKVSGWLGKWLPSVQTDVNFKDKSPIYILVGGVIVSIVLYKLIKKR